MLVLEVDDVELEVEEVLEVDELVELVELVELEVELVELLVLDVEDVELEVELVDELVLDVELVDVELVLVLVVPNTWISNSSRVVSGVKNAAASTLTGFCCEGDIGYSFAHESQRMSSGSVLRTYSFATFLPSDRSSTGTGRPQRGHVASISC